MAEISTNILTSLGAGSGIDIKKLVGDLVAAERAGPQAVLDGRKAAVETRISAQGQFLNAITTLGKALDSRIAAGDLSGVPQVSDPSILALTPNAGAEVRPQGIEVENLAAGQTLTSGILADAGAPLGTGEIRIRFGAVAGSGAAEGFTAGPTPDLVINVTEGADNLVAIRNLINANARVAGVGLEAQIVSDASGARLMLRGATGAAQGFLVETSGAPGLAAFAFNADGTGPMERTTVATDAHLKLNGVAVSRPTNTITDLVVGATIKLLKAAPGSLVTFDALRDPASLSATAHDLVEALNELQGIGRSLTARGAEGASAGALSTDSAAKRALWGLAGLVTKEILPENGAAPRSLSDIGVSIDRSGNFTIDETRLQKVASQYPEAFAAIISGLNTKQGFNTPAGPLQAIAQQFQIAVSGTPGHPSATLAEQQRILADQTRLDLRIDKVEARYTTQFTNLDRVLSVIKGQQDFLQQQIDLWTKKDNF